VIPIQRSSGLKRVEEEKDTPGGLDLARLYRLPVSSSSSDNLSQSLRQRALDEGFAVAGIAAVPGSSRLALRSAALERWLDAGYQGSMAWMADPRRRAINELLPGVRSVLAVGLNYHVKANRQPGSLAVARYGWGRDYHRVIDGRLRRLGRWLQDQVDGASWRTCVDSGPLMDKAWAEEAGLGWIGKHGNLINPKHGSWLLLGHLLTTVPLSPDKPAPARCGTCRLCIAACPTAAIREPFVVDSRRCISFHTIENRDPVLPPAIANHLQGWVAGCDICQDVCPWNRPDLPSATDPEVQPRPWLLDLQGYQALAWSDGDWDEHLRASALRRIKPWMWRRNLRAALGLSPPSA
jgi:epoxyqueuosine reductase